MDSIGTVVIVGAGLAGASAAEAIRKEGYDGRIAMFGAESHAPYMRPPLSKDYLRGETPREEVLVRPENWYDDQRVELSRASSVTGIDPGRGEILLDGGERVAFDRLLIATGSAPRRPDVPGTDLPGVHLLRTIDDADAIRGASSTAHRAVVVGGGWIGAEVTASLRQLGLPVTLVAPGSVPLERVLGREVGAIYRDLHVGHGVQFVPGRRVAAFQGTDRVEWVETDDGARIDGDLVVVGVGAVPRTQLASDAGLTVEGGIVVDEHLETSVPGIFAAGDIAAAWHPLFERRIRVEHWDNARRQGRAAGRNMLGIGEPYVRVPYFYSDQYDLSMEYAGSSPEWDRVVFRGDPATGAFLSFWLQGRLVVAGMNANTRKVNAAISALVASRTPVDVALLADPAVPLGDLLQPT